MTRSLQRVFAAVLVVVALLAVGASTTDDADDTDDTVGVGALADPA